MTDKKDFSHLIFDNAKVHQYCEQGMSFFEALERVRLENDYKKPNTDVHEYDDD